VLISFDNLRAAERREAASRLFARDELQLLRTQIDPHFLFNSLNSISALTSIDSAGARNMAISLADFFRKTLALSEHTTITVRRT
jgi:LytS/YehU family sensor histidine kinase